MFKLIFVQSFKFAAQGAVFIINLHVVVVVLVCW